jgi:hypothetical protein
MGRDRLAADPAPLFYDALTAYLPSPVVALHRAVAHGQVSGPPPRWPTWTPWAER